MSTSTTATLVAAFYDTLWNVWDDSAADDVLAADFTFRGSLGTHTEGREGWRAYRDSIRRGAPDFHNHIVDLIVDGDRAAARLRYTGTHTGELLGHRPTGRTFAYDGAAFFTRTGNQLASAWVLGDLAALTAQLAHPEAPTRDQHEEPLARDVLLAAVDRLTAPHYRWGDGCDGWRLVDGDDLSVIEERMPPGTAEAPHLHRQARQFFYVLTGHAELRTPHAAIALPAGTGVHVPAGEAHQFVNTGLSSATFLVGQRTVNTQRPLLGRVTSALLADERP